MGLLSQGSPLSWEETQRHADHVRRHGILQFLHIYHAVKDRHKDVLKWGDEVSTPATPRPFVPRDAAPAPGSSRPALPRGSPPLPRGSSTAQGCPGPCSEPLARLLFSIHSFGVPLHSANADRRWEGISVEKCDTGCLEEFSGWGVRRPPSDPPFCLKMPLT